MLRKRASNKNGRTPALSLFGLPFAGFAGFFFYISILPALQDWSAAKHWQPVSATLLTAGTRYTDDTGYAYARYRYQLQGQTWESDRVGVLSGSDNIGSWQKDKGRELSRSLKQGKSIRVYVNPENPAEAVIYRDMRWGMFAFQMGFILIFGAVGIGLIWAGLRKKTYKDPMADYPNEPWLANKDWSNPIRYSSKKTLIVSMVIAAIWNALSAPVLFAIPDELAKGNNAILIAAVFPLIGLALLSWVWVSFQRWRRFGTMALVMDPWPGCIGGQVGGRIQVPIQTSRDFLPEIKLNCLYNYYSGSGKNRSRKEKIIWQTSGYATVSPRAHGSELSFYFDVPAGLPASELYDTAFHEWRVDVISKLDGADLDVQFSIPVFPSSAPDTRAVPAHDQPVAYATQQTSGQPAAAMAPVNNTATYSSLERTSHTATEHPCAIEQRDAELEDLLNIKQVAGGVEMDFKMFRNIKSNLPMSSVGSVFFVAGLFLWEENRFISLGFCVLGGLIGLIGFYLLLNRYQVRLDYQGLSTKRHLLGVIIKKRSIPKSQIKQLVIKSNGSSQTGTRHVEHFVINAELNNGKSIRIAESLNGRPLAEHALKSLSVLTGCPTG